MFLKDDYSFKVLNQQFPRIALGIEIRWGTKDLEPYILSLLNDTREHTRYGFPNHICESLASLLDFHNKNYPEYKASPYDVWTINYSN